MSASSIPGPPGYLSVTEADRDAMLDVGIGLGYVPAAQTAVGTWLEIDVRGKDRRARVVKKPIYNKEH